MHKALILLVASTAIISTNAMLGGDTRSRKRGEFAFASMNMEALREANGLRQVRSYAPADHKLESGTEVGDWSTVDYTDIFACARGFAYGLQFSPVKQGLCYTAISEVIESFEDSADLMSQFYNPSAWAKLLQVQQNMQTFVATISTECNFQKFIKTITTDFPTFISSMAARVGGGLIMEIPQKYAKAKRATTCDQVTQEAARVFSILFDFYV